MHKLPKNMQFALNKIEKIRKKNCEVDEIVKKFRIAGALAKEVLCYKELQEIEEKKIKKNQENIKRCQENINSKKKERDSWVKNKMMPLIENLSKDKLNEEEKKVLFFDWAINAITLECHELLKLCVDRNFDVDNQLNTYNPTHNQNLLEYCAEVGFTMGVATLIKLGADVNHKTQIRGYIPWSLGGAQKPVVTAMVPGPMAFALGALNPLVIKILLRSGAEFPIVKMEGRYVLLCVYQKGNEEESLKFALEQYREYAFNDLEILLKKVDKPVSRKKKKSHKKVENVNTDDEQTEDQGATTKAAEDQVTTTETGEDQVASVEDYDSDHELSDEQKENIKKIIENFKLILDVHNQDPGTIFDIVSEAFKSGDPENYLAEQFSNSELDLSDLDFATMVLAESLHENLTISPEELIRSICSDPKKIHQYFSHKKAEVAKQLTTPIADQTIQEHEWHIEDKIYKQSDNNVFPVETRGFKNQIFIVIKEDLLDQHTAISDYCNTHSGITLGKSGGKGQNCLKLIKENGSKGKITNIELKIITSQESDLRLSGFKYVAYDEKILYIIDQDTNHREATSRDEGLVRLQDIREATDKAGVTTTTADTIEVYKCSLFYDQDTEKLLTTYSPKVLEAARLHTEENKQSDIHSLLLENANYPEFVAKLNGHKAPKELFSAITEKHQKLEDSKQMLLAFFPELQELKNHVNEGISENIAGDWLDNLKYWLTSMDIPEKLEIVYSVVLKQLLNLEIEIFTSSTISLPSRYPAGEPDDDGGDFYQGGENLDGSDGPYLGTLGDNNTTQSSQ